MPSTADRRTVVISSDDDDDEQDNVALAKRKPPPQSSSSSSKPSRPVVIISSDEEDDEDEIVDEADCVAVAAAEAAGSAELAASLGALTVADKKKEARTTKATKKKGDEDDDDGDDETPPPLPPPVAFGEVLLAGDVASQLYPHQKEGVAWMASLASGVAVPPTMTATSQQQQRRLFHGGILADEMGLGKTRQVAAFLRGAIDSGVVRRALVVAPKTLLKTWSAELAAVGLRDGEQVREYGSGSASDRSAALSAVASPTTGSGVLLTTYGMLLHNGEELGCRGSAAASDKRKKKHQASSSSTSLAPPQPPSFDAVFFDEGHTLKNPKAQVSQLARSLDCRVVKVLLSGTPVQNNLDELFALFDLVAPGLLADDARRFKAEFSDRIVAGSDRAASEGTKAAAAGAAAALRERMRPCFLRREKAAVLGVSSSSSSGGAGGGAAAGATAAGTGRQEEASSSSASSSPSSSATPAALGRKTDLIVWLRLTEAQRDVYRAFLRSEAVAEALNKTKSPLAAVTVRFFFSFFFHFFFDAKKKRRLLSLSFLTKTHTFSFSSLDISKKRKITGPEEDLRSPGPVDQEGRRGGSREDARGQRRRRRGRRGGRRTDRRRR